MAVPDALNLIDLARQNIQNCEYELSAIRARMDAIAEDVISREEMKPWMLASMLAKAAAFG
jgi:hypothetical protein